MEKKNYYVCKRLRLLEALLNAGFKVVRTIPDGTKFYYHNWIFERTPELDDFLQNYFKKFEK